MTEASDPDLNLLFYLFKEHSITPDRFLRMREGERVLVSAFCEHEIELKTR